MKKFIGIFMSFVLFFTGCASAISYDENESVKKQSRIEVYSVQNDEFLKRIDDQEMIIDFLKTDNWEYVNNLPDNLVPEHKLLVYQEKTLLFGQDPNEEREYELIETIITFQNSSYVEDIISSDVVKNMSIPQDVLTFYCSLSDDSTEQLNKLLE